MFLFLFGQHTTKKNNQLCSITSHDGMYVHMYWDYAIEQEKLKSLNICDMF